MRALQDLPATPDRAHLSQLISDLPYDDDALVVVATSGRLTLGELKLRTESLATTLTAAGVTQGMSVGVIVEEGAATLVAMLATWRVGGVYTPINGRYTSSEVNELLDETPIALIVASKHAADRHSGRQCGIVTHDSTTWESSIFRPADHSRTVYDEDVALALRTSGTTGRPKAVLLRHSGTMGALDSSLRKLRPGSRRDNGVAPRMNMIPTSLGLWAGIYNVTFSLRAGFGVVLLDKFEVAPFVDAVKEFSIRSTVLAPAMITMLVDATDVHDLSPLKLVRSITAPLPPSVAREFHNKFDAFVLNSYGQTELGGEVVGWTSKDVRDFGTTKLGAAGRPYDDVEIVIKDPEGSPVEVGELGEIHVNSPYRMHGYALEADGLRGSDTPNDRMVDGFIRTGDIGSIDEDGFVWIQGRVSDMINRGGLKVFPDEVEEVIRRHPAVRDAAVAGLPDRRLGEVPHAWVITDDESAVDELPEWCRRELVAYKVPAGFTRVSSFPRNDIGKVLRRQLVLHKEDPARVRSGG